MAYTKHSIKLKAIQYDVFITGLILLDTINFRRFLFNRKPMGSSYVESRVKLAIGSLTYMIFYKG